MSSGIPLLSVNKAGKQDWVPDEKDRSIISNQIPIAFLSVEFYGKATWVSSCISTARFSTYKKPKKIKTCLPWYKWPQQIYHNLSYE